MRRAALGALGIVLLACSSSGGADVTPSSSPSTAASNRAADLRTQLDLLLGEHVMIVAKESAAAVNHSDQYSSYTALLTTNSNDLTNLLGRAFGNTAATQLAQAWSIQNGYLVDYAIGVVTHNDAKANGAMSGLVNGFAPQFAQLITDASQLPLDSVTQLMKQQMLEDKAFIDDVFAQRYPAFYKNLHTAYAQTSQLGDALAARTAKKYPDKFPGDPAAQDVDARVAMNLLLQEHSYVATMATDATIAGRTAEAGAAAPALQYRHVRTGVRRPMACRHVAGEDPGRRDYQSHRPAASQILQGAGGGGPRCCDCNAADRRFNPTLRRLSPGPSRLLRDSARAAG
ncbi:MAG: hypothetical protein E6I35_00235 [Chloroflexi bacterium]|nr:MAG: hypothetical protein E6I35_00235 [Chloroflexota bacterium]